MIVDLCTVVMWFALSTECLSAFDSFCNLQFCTKHNCSFALTVNHLIGFLCNYVMFSTFSVFSVFMYYYFILFF
jgi:hypothetical protein